MKQIPNIELSRKDINLMLMSPFNEGGEAIICHGYDDHTLYKFFIGERKPILTFHHFSELSDMSDAKFQKICHLYEMNLRDSVQPISTLSCNGRLLGYEMTYDEDDIPLCHPKACITRKDLLHYAGYSKDY